MVDISTIDGLCRLSMSKLLLRALCQKRRAGGHATEAWLEPEAYLPPAEVLRTIRDYSSDMQELAHIWSFVINFNALASLTMPIEEDVNAGNGKGNVPDPVTMAALRPGAMLLEREDTSLLTEELKVERDKDTGAAKPKSMMKVISWLRKKDKDTVEITNRVALHDIVNQERFKAGLTTAGSKGIDAWARVGEDKVVLFQSKGQQKGSAVGQPGNDAVLTPKDLHDYIKSLMLSAYTSADDLVKHKIRAVCTAASEETRADCQTQLVCSCMLCARVCLYACMRVSVHLPLPPFHQKVTFAFHHRRSCSHPCFRVSHAPPG